MLVHLVPFLEIQTEISSKLDLLVNNVCAATE